MGSGGLSGRSIGPPSQSVINPKVFKQNYILSSNSYVSVANNLGLLLQTWFAGIDCMSKRWKGGRRPVLPPDALLMMIRRQTSPGASVQGVNYDTLPGGDFRKIPIGTGQVARRNAVVERRPDPPKTKLTDHQRSLQFPLLKPLRTRRINSQRKNHLTKKNDESQLIGQSPNVSPQNISLAKILKLLHILIQRLSIIGDGRVEGWRDRGRHFWAGVNRWWEDLR